MQKKEVSEETEIRQRIIEKDSVVFITQPAGFLPGYDTVISSQSGRANLKIKNEGQHIKIVALCDTIVVYDTIRTVKIVQKDIIQNKEKNNGWVWVLLVLFLLLLLLRLFF